MINESLGFISTALNAHFKKIHELQEDKVIVSQLVNSDGTIPLHTNDKVVLSFINMEQETGNAKLGFAQTNVRTDERSKEPVNINLFILVAANFNDYNESLDFISSVFNFFQSNHTFHKNDHPAIGTHTDKLIVELYRVNEETIHTIWSSLGAKYLPSMVYKIRIVPVDKEKKDPLL